MSNASPNDGDSSEGASAAGGDERPADVGQPQLSPSDTPTLDSGTENSIRDDDATRRASGERLSNSQDITRQPDPDDTSAPSDADRVKRKLRISAQLGIPLEPPLRDDAIGTLGNYQILKKVGRGGMGIVMRAFDTVLHRYVALKVMSASLVSSDRARERFAREARSAAGINHANVVTIHAIEAHEEIPYLVMEFVEGQTIEELIRGGSTFDVEEMVRIGSQIAAGLAEAHSQGIVHRDIKPSNILLDSLQRAKITDFGLARLLMDQSDLTSQGDVLGTPSYMSPEQVRGEEADEKSDLFSLGCLFYAMLAGRSPFHATTQIGMATRIQNDDPQPIPSFRSDVPAELDELIRELLKKEPSERPESAHNVGQRLSRMLISINQQIAHSGAPAARKERQLRPLGVVAAIALIVGAGWLAYFAQPENDFSSTQQATPTDDAPSDDTSTTNPASNQYVVVAKDGSGKFTTLTEALATIGPKSTIELKSGEYVESLMIAEDERFEGLTIKGIGMPKLSSPTSRSVMEIDRVTNLTVTGLTLSARHDQSALRIRGKCQGLTIRSCRFTSHDPQGEYSPLALVHIATSSGTKQSPLQLLDCELLNARIGLVIGVARTGAEPTRHLIVQNCRVLCESPNVGIPLVMYERVEQILVHNNTFSLGKPTLSFQMRDPEVAKEVLLKNNTIHAKNVVINFNLSDINQDISLVDNLFVGSSVMQGKTHREFHRWFKTNGWITLGKVDDSFLSMLQTSRYSADVLQSLDPSEESYLQAADSAPENLPGTKRTFPNKL